MASSLSSGLSSDGSSGEIVGAVSVVSSETTDVVVLSNGTVVSDSSSASLGVLIFLVAIATNSGWLKFSLRIVYS